jgi:dihydrodipicolinate synthase/N-acetylneuraminate lyase
MDPAFVAQLAQAAQQADARGAANSQQALGPITAGAEELAALPVKQLKALLAERGVAHADCLEKADLVRRIRERCSNVTYYK